MAGKEKIKKSRKLLWIGLAILGVGVLAFGGFLTFGLITLARDLLFTAIFADAALIGGSLGKKGVDSIANAISSRKAQKRALRKKRDIEKNQDKSNEQSEVVSPLVNVPSMQRVNKDGSMEFVFNPTDEEREVFEKESQEGQRNISTKR